MAERARRSLMPLAGLDAPRLRILHLMLTAGETSAPYNEHALAFATRHDITVGTYFPPTVVPPPSVKLFGGDGSVPGFFRNLHRALAAGPFDVVHAHAPHVALALLAYHLRQRRRPPAATVFTVHTSYPNVKVRNRAMMLPAFILFDQVVCCSQASVESFPRPFRRLAGDRLTVARNGVDVERVGRALRNRVSAERGRGLTVATVGRLIAIKDPLGVVTAFRQAAEADDRLMLIGDGPLRPAVCEHVLRSGLADRVELTGLIPRDAVYARLLDADLFVSTSSVEGLPVAVLEAMACGVPVVLSDIPPHREIAHGVDFIPLVAPGDLAGFAREIRRFQRLPAAQRRAIGGRCRELAVQAFSVEAMGQVYQDVYRRALAQRRGPGAAPS
jgi:glycosyltransferase involved in cell wall biosynthesis